VHPRAFVIIERQGRTGMLSRQFGELLAEAGLREKRTHQADPARAGRGGSRKPSRLSFHSLRRTATTLLHEAGFPPAVAQAFIGHDSAATHEIYVAVGQEMMARAANVFPNLL
jgi:integrase